MARKTTAERRRQVSQIVLGIIAEQGIEGVSMEAVARAAGIVPSALYRHYAGKDEMILAALNSFIDELETRMRALGPRPAAEVLAGMLAVQAEIMPLQLAIPQILFSPASKDQRELHRQAVKNLQDRILGGIAEVVQRGQAEGQFSPDIDPLAAAHLFMGLLVIVTLRWYVVGAAYDAAAMKKEGWRILELALGSAKSRSGAGRKGRRRKE
ncbi:TetR/AcrR family transcriptional regulator [bacterium]|nr:TetR/AcrR family transcriptional regulator [bacterium]